MFDLKFMVKPIKLELKDPRVKWWKKIGIREASFIKSQTQDKNVDVEGKSFKPYSEAYREARTSGKVRKPGGGFYGARGAEVDLTLSARMLNSIFSNIRATKRYVTIALVGSEAQKAKWIEEGGREFFGVGDQRADEIRDDYADQVIKLLDK